MKTLIMRTPYALLFYLCISAKANALPVIQEVYYDQIGSDGSEVFTEVYGVAGFDLTNWKLQGVNGFNNTVYRTIDLTGAIIPIDGLLLISTASANVSLSSISDFTANVDWQNGPDSLWLVDPIGDIVDTIQYGLTGFDPAGEGTPTTDVSAGQSLSRQFAGLDTNNNLADFVAGSPTPGSVIAPPKKVTSVSTPSMSLLFIFGLSSLIGLSRRRKLGYRSHQ